MHQFALVRFTSVAFMCWSFTDLKTKTEKTVLILFFIHASNLVKLFIEKGFGVKKSNESPITG